MMRRSKSRSAMREILGGGPGQLVLLDLRDDAAFLQGGRGAGGPRELVELCHQLGVDAHVIIGEADYLPADHPWGRKRRALEDGEQRLVEITQPTPCGPLRSHELEEPKQKPARTKMFLEQEADYAAAIALMREWRACRSDIIAHFRALRQEIGDRGLMTVFISQPLEMYFFILHDNMVMHYLDWPETYARAMVEVEQTSHCLIDCAAEAGVDMIMFGGAGTEIFNPGMIERHIVQPSIDYGRHCRERGLYSLMHCCGRTQVFLDRGWFEKLRPTVFESFTQSPLGDIASPAVAAHRLPPETFFKGGLSLDLLRRGTPEEVAAAVRQAYADFADRRFVLAGTCAILTGTPESNLLAVTETAREYEDPRT